jgi:CBS domain-containing protein
MQAQDIMTKSIITADPDTSIQEIAKKLIENRISAVPVVDNNGHLVGIVSEGDLMRRSESGTERQPSWWLFLLAGAEETAQAYVRAHGKHAADVMTRRVITVDEGTPIQEVAETLEIHRIKRVPVMSGQKLVGIISRANLLRGLAARQIAPTSLADDRQIKAAVEESLSEAGVRSIFLNVVVSGGVVNLWGMVETAEEKNATRVAAEAVPGVKEVRENIGVIPPSVRAVMWAD